MERTHVGSIFHFVLLLKEQRWTIQLHLNQHLLVVQLCQFRKWTRSCQIEDVWKAMDALNLVERVLQFLPVCVE
jgi:hypothetical protein